MKKVMFTIVAALAMTAMVACNNNSKPAEAEETAAATEQCEHKCAGHEGDSAMCCKAEAMAADSTKACCKNAEGGKCCKEEGKQCPKEAAE